ncbi:hypothetical protein DYB28_011246 [Aphanomyces astaci]|uniref:Peptidase A2 domain-containing protein n=1 Tax=Aphanomyces astaci TaxID=112090 RepID=A0A9X8H9U7_APHAT|nr:hypothetical protein DYB28_011246 [Aphanomyces astaci]
MPRWKTRRLRHRLRQQPQRHRCPPSLDDRKAAVAAAVEDSAKYDRKKATCGESEHGQVGERAQQEGDQASKQRKQSLGREAKIEGIVSVTTTLLDTGSDVTLVTADLMKSLERAGVEVKVISPEPSVIQPNGSSTCPQAVVEAVIQDKLRAAEGEGLTADLLEKLRLLLAKHYDVFRLEICHDEPIKVEPLRGRISLAPSLSIVACYDTPRPMWSS